MNEINLLDNIKQISNQSSTKMVTISQNRMVRSPNVKTLKLETITWEQFQIPFQNPNRYPLPFGTYIQYLNEFFELSEKENLTDNEKNRKKELKEHIETLKYNNGFWFGGTFKNNTRTDGVTSKSFITLDIDNIPQNLNFIERLQQNKYLAQFEYIVHSTAKHIPYTHQRYRLIIPLLEPITEDISLKYECITRHIANLIMDIKYFDTSAFIDNHLMLYPVVADYTPQGYYFYYHNDTKNFLNANNILNNYENYQDRYSFKGVERPKFAKSTPICFYSNNDKPITEKDIENIKTFLPSELLSCGIDNPMDLTNHRKKFGCICGSSDGANFYKGANVCCFSANHTNNLGNRSSNGDCYTYNIIDLYAYENNLDIQRDFIKIVYELAKKYNYTLENEEKVKEILYPSKVKTVENIKVDAKELLKEPTITYENIKSDEVLEYAYLLNDEISIVKYYDMLTTKANEMNIKGFKTLLVPYKKEALKQLKQREKTSKNKDSNGLVWTRNQFGQFTGSLTNCINILSIEEEYRQNLRYNEFSMKIMFKDTPINDKFITKLR